MKIMMIMKKIIILFLWHFSMLDMLSFTEQIQMKNTCFMNTPKNKMYVHIALLKSLKLLKQITLLLLMLVMVMNVTCDNDDCSTQTCEHQVVDEGDRSAVISIVVDNDDNGNDDDDNRC